MSTEQRELATPTGEAPVDFEPMDRSQFLLKGALAAGAIYGASAVGPLVQHVFAQSGSSASKGDLDILNFALTLEYLESDFYDTVLKTVKLSSQGKKFVTEVGQNEQDHVDALTKTIKDLGGKPAAKPKFTFPLTDEKSAMMLSVTFEDTGVSAYNGAGPMLQSKDLLATAGSIVQVEGRHAGAIRFVSGMQPVIEAFDTTLDMNAVLKAVKPFIKA